MTQAYLNEMKAYFEELRLRCDTPEKALAQLQLEGLVDENGEMAAKYREPAVDTAWP